MALLLSLKAAWDRRNEIVLGLLIIALMVIYCLLVKIGAQRRALAAQPKVEMQSETVTVKAPTVTKEKERRTIHRPILGQGRIEHLAGANACPPAEVEVIEIEREVFAGGEQSSSSVMLKQEPISLPDALSKRWYIGAAIDPSEPRKPRPRAGLTLWDRLDIGIGYDTRRPALNGGIALEAALRF